MDQVVKGNASELFNKLKQDISWGKISSLQKALFDDSKIVDGFFV